MLRLNAASPPMGEGLRAGMVGGGMSGGRWAVGGGEQIGGGCARPMLDSGWPTITSAEPQAMAKMDKAGHYSAICRPLWLALSIDRRVDLAMSTHFVRAVIAQGNPQCFDRVMVQQARTAPLIIER